MSVHHEAAGIDAGFTVVIVAVEELSARFGSVCPPETVAVFETCPGVDAVVTTSVMVALPPLANVPMAQVTVVVPLHDPCEGVAETKLFPAGSASVMVTPLAASGPPFTMLIVYVTFAPAGKGGAPTTDFAMVRSVDGLTVVIVAVEELFAGFGSVCPPETVAVFETCPGVDAVVTTRVIVAPAPLARVPTAQVTVVVPLHDPCEGVAETKLVPAGSASVMLTPLAASGPLFTMLIVYVTFAPAGKGGAPTTDFAMVRSAEGRTTNTHAAPELLLSKGPPTTAVFPSEATDTE
jgi:hypothetical protein